MQEFVSLMRTVFRFTLLVLVAAAILRYLLPYPLFFQGFLLGTSISLINGLVLYRKTIRIGEAAVDPAKRPRGIGMLERMLLIGSTAYFAFRYPQYFSLIGVLTGLFVLQIIYFIIFAIRSTVTTNGKKNNGKG